MGVGDTQKLKLEEPMGHQWSGWWEPGVGSVERGKIRS